MSKTIYLPDGTMKFIFTPEDFKEFLQEYIDPSAEEYFQEFENELTESIANEIQELDHLDTMLSNYRQEFIKIWTDLDKIQELIKEQNTTSHKTDTILKNLVTRLNTLI